MTKATIYFMVFIMAVALALPVQAVAGDTQSDAHGSAYTADGRLIPPQGYYQWVFVTSDLGMNYNEESGPDNQPPFSNVFVNPAAYRSFLKTGTWPDKTVLVKEFRPSATKGSINHHGYFQSGKALSVLVHVKDEKRFKGGWAFFAFGGDALGAPAKQIPTSADCYSCHEAHGAVDTTFVQFYPTLLPIAMKRSTLSGSYLKEEVKRTAPTATSHAPRAH